MAAERNFQRERNKEKLRKQVLNGNGKRFSAPRFIRYYRGYIIFGIVAAAIVVLLTAGVYSLYNRVRNYSTYKVNWQTKINNSASMQYIATKNGVLAVGRDGITYFDQKGNDTWTYPYDIQTPVIVQRGDYILIYSTDGRDMYICTENGISGTITANYSVSKADISEGGVVAAVLEDSRSSYIQYFRNDGSRLDVEIQSPLATNGYPLAISMSPNGQKLMVSYYQIKNGQGSCRINFYDFTDAQNENDRILAEFSYEESDTYIPLVKYINNTSGIAVGDNRLLFYKQENGTMSESAVEMENEIQKVFWGENRIGLVAKNNDSYEVLAYSVAGKVQAHFSRESMHESYSFAKGGILMYSQHNCTLVTMRGRERLDLEFQNEIYQVVPSEKRAVFYLGTMDTLQQIRLK